MKERKKTGPGVFVNVCESKQPKPQRETKKKNKRTIDLLIQNACVLLHTFHAFFFFVFFCLLRACWVEGGKVPSPALPTLNNCRSSK